MSDQRPEWMPEEQVILMIQDGEYIDGEIDDAFCKTGLRAKLHELESLIVGHEGSHMVDRVKVRIEEIRKELG